MCSVEKLHKVWTDYCDTFPHNRIGIDVVYKTLTGGQDVIRYQLTHMSGKVITKPLTRGSVIRRLTKALSDNEGIQ